MSKEEMTITTRQEFEQVLIARASEDAAFRKALLKDPKGVMKAIGVDLSEDIQIEVLEETPTKFYLVLPPLSDEELSDEELAQAAGGIGLVPPRLQSYLKPDGISIRMSEPQGQGHVCA